MATQKLNIDIIARDKSKKALNNLQTNLGKLKSSIFNLRNAFLGLGAGLVIRNLVNTGKEIENLRTRLKFLLKNTNEGAKAFDNMTKFASKVPFSLEEISRGSGILATVTDNAKDLQKMLEITGNVAAVTGLDFRTAAEQIQRSFSAGIGAADLFREKGVRNMLGFQAGAEVSIEATVEAFNRVFGKGGRFGRASDELAKTFEGTLSMIGDKVFNFKKVLLEAGFFAELKHQFGDLNKFLEKNSKTIDAVAEKMGRTLGKAVAGIAKNMKKVKENIHGFRIAIEILISLNIVIFLTNVAKALMLVAKSSVLLGVGLSATKKGIAGIVTAGVLLGGVFKGVDKLFEDLLKDIEELSKWEHKFQGNPFEKTRQSIEGISDETKKLNEEFDKAFKSNQISKSHNNMHEMMNETFEKTKNLKETFREINQKELEDFATKMKNIKTTIAEGMNQGIKSFSDSLARAVILGENLTESFKKIAQDLAIRLLSITIEIVLRKQIELILERKKTSEMKNQTSELKKQLALKAVTAFFGGFAQGGAVSKGKPIVVGERGPEVFVPNSSGQIQQNARGVGGGEVNVNFNIEAIDSSSFNNVLVENRGVITSIINNALNEKGRRELI